MHAIPRRTAALGAALLATTALVAACTPAQVTSTLQTLANGWAALPGLFSAAGIAVPTNVSSKITAALADLQANAAKIGTAVAAPPTTVQAIVSDIQLVASLAAPFYPPAGAIGALIAAGVSLAGTLLSEAGIGGAPVPGATLTYAGAPVPAPVVALMILRGAGK